MAQLWGGRFTKETDKLVYNFNASINFDKKFYKQDMEGSIAHVKMLAAVGILTDEERDIYRRHNLLHFLTMLVLIWKCLKETIPA